MSVKMVPLRLRNTVSMPQVVVIPSRIAHTLEIPRRFTITSRTQDTPEAVQQFLRGDPRYGAWFEDVVLPSPESAAAPAEPEGGAEVDPEETWSAQMVVPVLRDYAKRHGVELASDDKKDDILMKLRAEREAFEVKETE